MTVESVMLVADFFNGNLAKTKTWFATPSYQFGGLSPNQLVEFGRGGMVADMIKFMAEESG